MKNIIFIAPPSAGKGTYASYLSKKYGIPHISIGQALREVAKRQDELGRYVLEAMSHAELIRDDLVYQVLEERLSQKDCKQGYILDGFPRTIEQAVAYGRLLKKLKRDLGKVIVIDVDEEVLAKRVTGRRTCEKCGAIYNLNLEESMPKDSSTCDECGGKLLQRPDDNLETFEARYHDYLEKEKALIDYYEQKGVLYHLDGNQEKETCLKELERILADKDPR